MPSSRRSFVLAAMSAAAVFTLASAGFAGTIYVPGDHATIQAAVDASSPGDVIFVSPGTYAENVVISGAAHEGLQIYGQGRVVIEGQGTLPALTVKGAFGIDIHTLEIAAGGTGVLVTKSKEIRLDGIHVAGTAGDGVVIDRSVAVYLSTTLVTDAGGDGVAIGSSYSVGLDGVDVAGAAESGIEVVLSDGVTIESGTVQDAAGDGVSVADSEDVSVCGNTISDCGESGIECSDSTTVVLDENLIDDTAADGMLVSKTDGIVLYSNTIGGDPTGTIGGDAVRVEDSVRLDMQTNYVGGAAGDGLYVDGSGAAVNDNEFADVGGIAVHLSEETSYAFVTLNTIANPAGSGIVVLGESNTVTDNEIAYAGRDGIEIHSGNNLARGNDVIRPVNDGLCVLNVATDAAVFVEDNSVVKPGDDGIDLGATSESEIRGNSVTRARDNGFELITGTGNLLDGNHAVKSRGFDLFEGLDASANDVTGTNKFKSMNQRKRNRARR